MEQRRRHYFPANDCTVITGIRGDGQYGAYRQDNQHPQGVGYSRFAAIADLVEMIAKWEEESDDELQQAAE